MMRMILRSGRKYVDSQITLETYVDWMQRTTREVEDLRSCRRLRNATGYGTGLEELRAQLTVDGATKCCIGTSLRAELVGDLQPDGKTN